MAFPQVAETLEQTTASGTSHVLTLTGSAVGAGDLLMVFGRTTVVINSVPGSWGTMYDTLNTVRGFGYKFKAAGGETTATWGTSTSGVLRVHVVRIAAGQWSGNLDDIVDGTPATAASGDPNPPSLDPPWDTEDVLWFAHAVVAQNAGTGITSYPSNYTNGDDVDRLELLARRENAASSEDPGVFDLTGTTGQYVANTVAVRPWRVVAIAGNQPAGGGTIRQSGRRVTGAQPSASGTLVAKLSLIHKSLAGAQPAGSGALAAEFIGGVVEVSLAGNQPAATGTIRSLQYKALAGAQPAPAGALVAEWVNKYLAGAQPNATGALTVKRVLTHIALAGAQPNATGTIASLRTSFKALAGAQPAAAGTVAFKRSLSHVSLAGAQPNGTGALALIKTLKALAGAQPAASGSLAIKRVLTHVSLTGAQPSASGALALQRLLTHIALAGNQPAASGAVAAVSAAFIDLAGNQPAAAGALVSLVTSKHLSGDQPAAVGALVVEWLLAHVYGNQPAGSGTIAAVVPLRDVGFAPVGGFARGEKALAAGRARAVQLGVGSARVDQSLGRGRGRLGT